MLPYIRRAVVELGRTAAATSAGPVRPSLLQIDHLVEKAVLQPRLGNAFRLFDRNDIGRRLLEDPESVDLQLAKDWRLSCAGRAGQDETLHPGSAAMASRNGPISRAANGSIRAMSLSL